MGDAGLLNALQAIRQSFACKGTLHTLLVTTGGSPCMHVFFFLFVGVTERRTCGGRLGGEGMLGHKLVHPSTAGHA